MSLGVSWYNKPKNHNKTFINLIVITSEKKIKVSQKLMISIDSLHNDLLLSEKNHLVDSDDIFHSICVFGISHIIADFENKVDCN